MLATMKRRDDQITLRVPGTLRAALESESAARGIGLSILVRKILIEHAAGWNVRLAEIGQAVRPGQADAGAPR
jgi:hypothetical protein